MEFFKKHFVWVLLGVVVVGYFMQKKFGTFSGLIAKLKGAPNTPAA